MSLDPVRRRLLRLGATGIGAMFLSGCDRLAENKDVLHYVKGVETLTYRVQRWLLARNGLAPEFTEADLSKAFRANGTTHPSDSAYKALVKSQFANWKLEIGGLVDKPLQLSLSELRAMPSRTQITRHDCVEGWSCIGKWKGVPLSHLLDLAGVKGGARFVVFHCADTMEGGETGDTTKTLDGQPIRYYESIDLQDARHPQTILAYDMNDQALPVDHGAPLRLRVERQLGYKMAKYVMRVELVESLAMIGEGNGGYWEDRGYEWYAGI